MVSNSKAVELGAEPGAGGIVPETAGADDPWRPLRYFNLYRALLSGLIIALAFFGVAPRHFGFTDPGLFWTTAVLYFAFSVLASLAIRFRWGSFRAQVVVQVCADIVAITLMMHASGGVASGFGMLLVVAIAGGSLLTEGRIAILFAALASLAVLAEQIYAWRYPSFIGSSYTQAGMLGITFFATAFLGYTLARRVRASEALAAKRGIDLANLASLNEHIIQRMQSGVLVLDEQDHIRLVNGSARQLLGVTDEVAGRALAEVAPELVELEARWRGDGQTSQLFRPGRGAVDVFASFARLGRDGSHGALVFLEDASAMRSRAQQLKLASLGRLTASIAHEIRNPLGAISHAGQLLAESPSLGRAEQRLLQIVEANCRRMNAIVENILQLSRRKAAVRETMELAPWLEGFAADFAAQAGIDPRRIEVRVGRANLRVRVDASQLHQVAANLCENALRHGGPDVRIRLQAEESVETGRPYLEIVDDGPGIDQATAEHLFEPFFTTEPEGTGLGLYIARELCEINQASLDLVPGEPASGGAGDGRGCCFRITFSDPRRQGAMLT